MGALKFRRAFTGLTSASLEEIDFPTSLIDNDQFMDPDPDPYEDPDKVVSESVSRDISGDAGPLVYEMGVALAGDPGGTEGGEPIFDLWTGPSQTGNQFTIIGEDTAFGGETSYEVRVYSRLGRFELSEAQRDYHVLTTVYLDAQFSHTLETSMMKAMERQFMRAVGSYVLTLSQGGAPAEKTANAGENLAEGEVYIGSDGLVYQLDDPSSLIQAVNRGWVETAYTTGQSVTVKLAGSVTPSSYTPIKGVDLFVGNNGLPTYEDDPSANAWATGDYIAYLGRSYDGTTIDLNCHVPVTGKAVV